MPDHRRTTCRQCDRHRDDVGGITWSGLCTDCAKTNVHENIEGLVAMTGPIRDRWARGMILSVGGVLPERLQTRS